MARENYNIRKEFAGRDECELQARVFGKPVSIEEVKIKTADKQDNGKEDTIVQVKFKMTTRGSGSRYNTFKNLDGKVQDKFKKSITLYYPSNPLTAERVSTKVERVFERVTYDTDQLHARPT
jgi:hypothetical protein